MSGGMMVAAGDAATTLCRCWRLARRDGVVMGFTDHDAALAFDGIDFRPDDGMSARALEAATGLAVDNSAALGALSAERISEADIAAGRYDRAEVTCWRVDWTDVARREVLFAGELGEIRRQGGAFEAELRGLAEALNQPRGRMFQKPCSAVLGDGDCGVDLSAPGLSAELVLREVRGGAVLVFDDPGGFAPRWFERGRALVLEGTAAGAVGVVKNDRQAGPRREVELWEGLAGLVPGSRVRLEPGCDKRLETCREKFDNLLNYRGFPHLPSADWLVAHPSGGAEE